MIDEKVLAGALHELAGQDDEGAPPVARLLRRGHRARLVRFATLSTLTTAAVALGAVVAVGVPALTRPAPGTVHATAGHASFALVAQTTARAKPHLRDTVTVTGGKDPFTKTYPYDPGGIPLPVFQPGVRGADSASFCFTKPTPDPRKGVLVPDHCFGIPPNAIWSETQTTDPTEMLEKIRSIGSVSYLGRTGTGATARDNWKLSYTIPADGYDAAFTVTGTMTVNAATNLVTAVSLQQPLVPAPGLVSQSFEFIYDTPASTAVK